MTFVKDHDLRIFKDFRRPFKGFFKAMVTLFMTYGLLLEGTIEFCSAHIGVSKAKAWRELDTEVAFDCWWGLL